MANEKILVVEDEQGVAELIAHYLQAGGYRLAGWARSGGEALALAAQTHPDLALMDIALHGNSDGVRVAQELRAQFNVPVVFLTGLIDEATIQRAQEANAFGYVVKPFRQEDLKTSIDLALNKHEFESKLRQIERWFGAAIRSIGDAVITTDETGKISFLNPAAEGLTGWKQAEALGRTLGEVLHLQPKNPGAARTTNKPSPSDTDIFSGNEIVQNTTLLTRANESIPVEGNASPIRNESGVTIGRVLVVRDISARRRAEEDLNHSREQLRLLAAHVESVREEERTRIAREIHDELGQILTGLKMDLAWMEKRIGTLVDLAQKQPLLDKAGSVTDLLDRMVKTVRRISTDLRPEVLDDLGLLPALEWEARDWQTRTGTECQVVSSINSDAVSPACGTALFRIFQEALTNVARHAQARKVQARLQAQGSWLFFEIQDDGRGFSEQEQRAKKTFGLLGMKERSRLLGGECVVHGIPGKGTTVLVKVPLARRSS